MYQMYLYTEYIYVLTYLYTKCTDVLNHYYEEELGI
jgi:hypothetical protein